jgi:pyruvate dehydrogenase E2 component (dihydrolipoyllysine-residue acetyltransferase)
VTAATLNMPKLSDSMEEATIVRWLKEPGDTFARGEPLAEIETDKATIVYEAEADGVIGRIVVPEGESARLGDPIATLGSDGTAEPAPSPSERVRATPVARRRAVELGVSLHELSGTGPDGRITIQDVERAAGEAALAAPEPSAKGAVELVPLTPTQATIARRMEQASAIPTFTVTIEIDMSNVVALRHEAPEPKPSVNDFLVRAAALTLREFPAFNSAWIEGRVERYSRMNIGIAVAAEGALLVPTLFDADEKPLAQIAEELRSLAERARSRTLTPKELTSSTFTVSNLGMYGVHSFTAIVDPPQVAILAVGGIHESRMLATLSADHRVVYGADGAEFLAKVKSFLEDPSAL